MKRWICVLAILPTASFDYNVDRIGAAVISKNSSVTHEGERCHAIADSPRADRCRLFLDHGFDRVVRREASRGSSGGAGLIYQSSGEREKPVSAVARAQPRRLVSVGRRGVQK